MTEPTSAMTGGLMSLSEVDLPPRPARGDIWLVSLGAARRGELGKVRPAVVVSSDGLQMGTPYDLITVVPVTTAAWHRSSLIAPAMPAGGGLQQDSVVLCDAPRAIVPARFLRRLGEVSDQTLCQIIEARSYVEGWDCSHSLSLSGQG